MARLDSEQLRGLAQALDAFGEAVDYGVTLVDSSMVMVADGNGEQEYIRVEFDGENGIFVVDF